MSTFIKIVTNKSVLINNYKKLLEFLKKRESFYNNIVKKTIKKISNLNNELYEREWVEYLKNNGNDEINLTKYSSIIDSKRYFYNKTIDNTSDPDIKIYSSTYVPNDNDIVTNGNNVIIKLSGIFPTPYKINIENRASLTFFKNDDYYKLLNDYDRVEYTYDDMKKTYIGFHKDHLWSIKNNINNSINSSYIRFFYDNNNQSPLNKFNLFIRDYKYIHYDSFNYSTNSRNGALDVAIFNGKYKWYYINEWVKHSTRDYFYSSQNKNNTDKFYLVQNKNQTTIDFSVINSEPKTINLYLIYKPNEKKQYTMFKYINTINKESDLKTLVLPHKDIIINYNEIEFPFINDTWEEIGISKIRANVFECGYINLPKENYIEGMYDEETGNTKNINWVQPFNFMDFYNYKKNITVDILKDNYNLVSIMSKSVGDDNIEPYIIVKSFINEETFDNKFTNKAQDIIVNEINNKPTFPSDKINTIILDYTEEEDYSYELELMKNNYEYSTQDKLLTRKENVKDYFGDVITPYNATKSQILFAEESSILNGMSYDNLKKYQNKELIIKEGELVKPGKDRDFILKNIQNLQYEDITIKQKLDAIDLEFAGLDIEN